MPDYVHMCFGIPPRFSVANAVGKLKGKSAIAIRQKFRRKHNFVGLNFWSTGYCVSTVGIEGVLIIQYIQNQEAHDKREDQ